MQSWHLKMLGLVGVALDFSLLVKCAPRNMPTNGGLKTKKKSVSVLSSIIRKTKLIFGRCTMQLESVENMGCLQKSWKLCSWLREVFVPFVTSLPRRNFALITPMPLAKYVGCYVASAILYWVWRVTVLSCLLQPLNTWKSSNTNS